MLIKSISIEAIQFECRKCPWSNTTEEPCCTVLQEVHYVQIVNEKKCDNASKDTDIAAKNCTSSRGKLAEQKNGQL